MNVELLEDIIALISDYAKFDIYLVFDRKYNKLGIFGYAMELLGLDYSAYDGCTYWYFTNKKNTAEYKAVKEALGITHDGMNQLAEVTLHKYETNTQKSTTNKSSLLLEDSNLAIRRIRLLMRNNFRRSKRRR